MFRQPIRASIFDINPRAETLPLVSLTVLAILLAVVPVAQAQTYTVLHNFIGGADETNSQSGLTISPSGQLYGTTLGPQQCTAGCGTVYRISRAGTGWILSTLYAFRGGTDGSAPGAPVTIAADGSLYGTTGNGGLLNGCYGSGCGTVYHMQPPATICKSVTCPWTETTLYTFQNCPSLNLPGGGVAFDRSGNIVAVTGEGGLGCQDNNEGWGGVYELTPSSGGWTYQVVYQFTAGFDGCTPRGTPLVNQAGNILGTNYECGANGAGAVYEIKPSGSGWSESIVYNFGQTQTDGAEPFAGLISDSAGNLYGTTAYGGLNGSGEVFELSPAGSGYTYSVLYNSFSGGVGSTSRLTMDAAGNLYGVQYLGGANNKGMVFKLTPGSGSWTLSDLHDFDVSSGSNPIGQVALDAAGNLYGTTTQGGANGNGVIWEVTP